MLYPKAAHICTLNLQIPQCGLGREGLAEELRGTGERERSVGSANGREFRLVKWCGCKNVWNQGNYEDIKWNPLTTRPRGRPKYRWEDNIIQDLGQMEIKNWLTCVRDRAKWKDVVEKAKTSIIIIIIIIFFFWRWTSFSFSAWRRRIRKRRTKRKRRRRRSRKRRRKRGRRRKRRRRKRRRRRRRRRKRTRRRRRRTRTRRNGLGEWRIPTETSGHSRDRDGSRSNYTTERAGT